MLNFDRGAENYRKNQVATATEGQLILMLYDGALRFLTRAKTAIDEKNTPESHNYITKARRIILELMVSLDMEKGGEISKNLNSLYFFINQELIKANIKKDKEILDECFGLIKELRETWKEVIEKNKKENTVSVESQTQTKKIDIKN
ncbi:MAG: flagellar export chaperone FliS [Candidatus Muiribacteriota bacterium]|jgi:flagellar protein FliS